MRSHQCAAEDHGESACDTGADDAGRKDAAGIGSCEGDSTLSDECKAHDEVDGAGFSLFLGELVLEHDGCQCDCAGRNHTADHDCCHDVIVACCDGCCTENVSCLVEGAAHVDGHHAAEDQAEDELAAAAHAAQSIVQTGVEGSDGRLNNEHHDQACQQNTEQGIQKDGRDLLDGLGKVAEELLQEEYDVTSYETGDQGAEETGLAVCCDHAADETDCKTGSVSDTLCDVTCQDGEHEAECHSADGFQSCSDRGDGTEVSSVCHRQCVHID